MPNIVTHFTNSLKKIDREKNRLKPAAFIHPDTSEISVVCIDEELTLPNANDAIFSIGDKIYKSDPKVKARGDMNTSDIEQLTYSNSPVHVDPAPTKEIPGHYNIKPDFHDLEFANYCAVKLSEISTLYIK